MKILMTLIMATAMTSAFAAGECKLGAECKEADCKALNKDYAIIAGKCANPKGNETETQCAGIVSTSGAKGSEGTSAAGKNGAEGVSK